MSKREKNLWQGIDVGARNALSTRNYRAASFAQELSERGVDASELAGADRNKPEIKEAWIPGVVMFFLHGRAEMILCDVRAGFPKRMMRFFIDGDNHRSNNNVGVVVPPGVAHAIRAEGSEDVIMVYGTSTIFHPEFEGRIASEIETAQLPESWETFLRSEM